MDCCPQPGVSDQRRAAMLSIARVMFLEKGFARTSMSAVAARMGGSKTTLWSYFPNKEALFVAAIEDLIEEFGGQIRSELSLDGPLETVLRDLSRNLLNAFTSKPITAIKRIAAAEVGAIPGFGLRFHEQGLAKAWETLGEFLAEAQRRGMIRAEVDCHRAAQHLIGLLRSGCYLRQTMSDSEEPSQTEIAGDVDAAVDAFCRAYAAVQVDASLSIEP